jgi:hypothetical protein
MAREGLQDGWFRLVLDEWERSCPGCGAAAGVALADVGSATGAPDVGDGAENEPFRGGRA